MSGKHKDISKSSIDGLITEIKYYILKCDLEQLSELTINKISDHFEINRCYLSRKFKDTTQMLLKDFLALEKIKRSENLLKTRPDLSIEDVSALVGYQKVDAFRSQFKKNLGVNPYEYRKFSEE